jgi:hypothetical protein
MIAVSSQTCEPGTRPRRIAWQQHAGAALSLPLPANYPPIEGDLIRRPCRTTPPGLRSQSGLLIPPPAR